MSSTNKTAELHLSQFIGTDIPSILTDYNGDMQKIDAGVREVKQATAGAVSDLSSVTARVTNAEQDISGLNTTVQGIATRVTGAEGNIVDLQGDITDLQETIDIPNNVILTFNVQGLTSNSTCGEYLTAIKNYINNYKQEHTEYADYYIDNIVVDDDSPLYYSQSPYTQTLNRFPFARFAGVYDNESYHGILIFDFVADKVWYFSMESSTYGEITDITSNSRSTIGMINNRIFVNLVKKTLITL